MKKNIFTKFISVLLLIVLGSFMLVSCSSLPIKSDKNARAIVGKVGMYNVTYEEIYFLVHNYRDILDAKHGKDAYKSDEIITVTDDNGDEREVKLSEYYYESLEKLIFDNITSNYAVLTLAEKEGISIDDDDIKDEIQTKLDTYIETEFEGKRGNYKDYLKEHYITDNYLRFTLGVDILYSKLATELLKKEAVDDSADSVKSIKNIINEKFVRTWHVMIINDGDGDADYKKAEEALGKLKSGEKTMYEMIGSKYNEDFMNTTLNGYYFTRGSMDPAYEDAAYALDINEISNIVTAIGEDSYGNKVECYYIIQRLPMEEEYIDKNYETLKSSYFTAMVYEEIEKSQASLTFDPNDRYNSLDLFDLEAPKHTDMLTVIIISSVAGGVIVVSCAVILTVFIIKKRKRRI